jgi:hypothetical protein
MPDDGHPMGFGGNELNLPLRQPAVLTSALANLDLLSGPNEPAA